MLFLSLSDMGGHYSSGGNLSSVGFSNSAPAARRWCFHNESVKPLPFSLPNESVNHFLCAAIPESLVAFSDGVLARLSLLRVPLALMDSLDHILAIVRLPKGAIKVATQN